MLSSLPIFILIFISITQSFAQPSRIFWADQSYKKIQSAYLNGSQVTDIATDLQSVEGIAIDTSVTPMKIYYCESGLNRIMKMNFNGSDPEEVVTDITGLEDLDLDLVNRKVFWLKNSFDDDRVQSADMDSLNSNIKDIYKSSYAMHDFRGIALDTENHFVYWSQSVYANYDRISRINYDGSGREIVVSINYIRDIDAIGNMLYWIRSGGDLLIRSDMEVSYLDTLVTDVNSLFFTMDTSLGMAFWTGKFGTAQSGRIMRAKLDNTDTREIVIGVGNNLTGIALYYNPDFDTAIEQDYNIPKNCELFQNYPNPFNPVTVISWQLPVRSHADLSIYNIIGQKVATLINKNQSAGKYEVEWDASGFPSGVYFCKLETDSYIKTRKLILLK